MGVVGADVSGCVRLTLDANSRITDVDISTAWRDRVGPDNLSEAILQAAANGMQSAHGLQYEQREMKPTGRPSIEVDQIWRLFDEISQSQSDAVMIKLASVIDAAIEELEAMHDSIDACSPAQIDGEDSKKRTRVRLSPIGLLQSVSLNRKWLLSTTTDKIRDALSEAFSCAYRRLREADIRATMQRVKPADILVILADQGCEGRAPVE